MSTPPQITTIIPTYRRPKHVARAIRSALAQTYPHIRVCVYDNASGDETGDVVRAIAAQDPRVEYVERSENIGGVANMTDALARVETPFFAVLPDDDFLLPTHYETVHRAFAAYPAAYLVSGATIYVDLAHRILYYPVGTWQAGYFPPPDGAQLMLERGDFSLVGCVYRREVITELGGWDPSDFDLMEASWHTRIAMHAPYVFTAQPGAIFVQARPGRPYGGRSISTRLAEVLGLYDKRIGDEAVLRVVRDALTPAVQRYIAQNAESLGRLAIAHGGSVEYEAVRRQLAGIPWLADVRGRLDVAARRARLIPGYRWAEGFTDRHLLRLRWVNRELVHWRRAARLRRTLGPLVELLGPPIGR